MACTSPISGYRSAKPNQYGNYPVIVTGKEYGPWTVYVPCGMCISCRLAKARDWSIRCNHEAQLHEENSFLTLTYSDEELPKNGGLYKPHFQKFMKRLRKKTGEKIRYFMCGEYGSKTGRAHYHALLFGYDFPDKTFLKESYSGERLYTSENLDQIWTHGHCYLGSVTSQSAGYVARYSLKKVMGKFKNNIDEETGLKPYERIDENGEPHEIIPEYVTPSLKPGIGANWFEKFYKDIFPSDEIPTIDGKTYPVPEYYLTLLERKDPEMHRAVKAARLENSKENPNHHPDRLKARAYRLDKSTKSLKRSLE